MGGTVWPLTDAVHRPVGIGSSVPSIVRCWKLHGGADVEPPRTYSGDLIPVWHGRWSLGIL